MSELEQYRVLVLATLEYLDKNLSDSIVTDGISTIKDYYEQQKRQVEQYFKKGNLDKLKGKFIVLIEPLLNEGNLLFNDFIREKTNQSIDIFSDVKAHVRHVVLQKSINSKKEEKAVSIVLNIYEKTGDDAEYAETLRKLLNEYHQKKDGAKKVTKKTDDTLNVQEIISPDGEKRLNIIQWTKGKNSSTYVSVIFKTASSVIYGKSGLDYNIKATWENDETVIITAEKETTDEYIKHKQIRSFDDTVNIVYIEY